MADEGKPDRSKIGKRSKQVGAEYERRIGKIFSEWAHVDPARYFRRTPKSGAWSKELAPGDLVVPEWFPFVIECKFRESFEFHHILTSPVTNLPLIWITDEEKKLEAELNKLKAQLGSTSLELDKMRQEVILVFGKANYADYIMMRLETMERMIRETVLSKLVNPRVTYVTGNGKFVICLLSAFTAQSTPHPWVHRHTARLLALRKELLNEVGTVGGKLHGSPTKS